MKTTRQLITLAIPALALCLGVCGPMAQAQQGQGQAQIEEILVTATKRAESIQDVPVSVSVISADTMAATGITDMEDLSLYVPNFEINSASILPNLYVRGLGSGATHSIEQSVGRFVDEVYIGRAAINLHGFMDLASVEVLRGPQGTLFGKNTVGGALIMHTADPTRQLRDRVLTVGEQLQHHGRQQGISRLPVRPPDRQPVRSRRGAASGQRRLLREPPRRPRRSGAHGLGHPAEVGVGAERDDQRRPEIRIRRV